MNDRYFHLLMATMLMVSCAIDQQDIGWRAGQISIVSLGLAMVWIGRFVLDGFQRRDARAQMLRNRVTELEERLDQLEREARDRRGPF